MTANGTGPCYLLDMPKELRLAIYDLTLKPSSSQIVSYDLPPTNLSQSQFAKTKFYVDRSRRLRLSPALLRTCRQIYEEASTIIYKADEVRLTPSCDEVFIDDRENRAFDATNLHHIRVLDRLQVDLAAGTSSAAEDLRHSKVLRSCFNDNLTAKTMQIDIFDKPDAEKDQSEPIVLKTLEMMLKVWTHVATCRTIWIWYVNFDQTTLVHQRKIHAREWERVGNERERGTTGKFFVHSLMMKGSRRS